MTKGNLNTLIKCFFQCALVEQQELVQAKIPFFQLLYNNEFYVRFLLSYNLYNRKQNYAIENNNFSSKVL